MSAVRLSLVSHTNAGKTTLARTLLGRDIGEVRDAPHVTEFAEMHSLLKTAAGDELQLWDTPGFGDSVRLVRRLRQRDTPLGWFLAEVWDRWRDRPLWASQQALRHVKDDSDVVLYLVNAAESPAAAGYVAPEMELLAWVGKPVLVLLNQLGAPRDAAAEAADVERWRAHLAAYTPVRDVLPLDAFARCWVQEGVLLRTIAHALGGADARLERLQAEWAARRWAVFDASMRELAGGLGRIAAAHVPLAGGGWGIAERLRPGRRSEAETAERMLAEGLDREVRAGTARLLSLHGIEGRAEGQILERVAAQVELREPVGEGRAALVGGVVTGALAGLKADLLAGGLTLGGGMLAGGLLGALGAAGVARALNVVRGTGAGFAAWSERALGPLVEAALLRYLAVAHFGRGRGQWAEGEAPPHWRGVVVDVLAAESDALGAVWSSRATSFENAGEAERLAAELEPLLACAARAALERLYPGAIRATNDRADR
jgi:hypothetical protein